METYFTGAEELRGKIPGTDLDPVAEVDRTGENQTTPAAGNAGATFSISNLGMYDVDNFIAVLMLLLRYMHRRIRRARCWPSWRTERSGQEGGMSITLSCDHRALDGMQAAQFLKEFKRILEHPQELAKQGTTS